MHNLAPPTPLLQSAICLLIIHDLEAHGTHSPPSSRMGCPCHSASQAGGLAHPLPPSGHCGRPVVLAAVATPGLVACGDWKRSSLGHHSGCSIRASCLPSDQWVATDGSPDGGDRGRSDREAAAQQSSIWDPLVLTQLGAIEIEKRQGLASICDGNLITMQSDQSYFCKLSVD